MSAADDPSHLVPNEVNAVLPTFDGSIYPRQQGIMALSAVATFPRDDVIGYPPMLSLDLSFTL